jgi:hypothetical protein
MKTAEQWSVRVQNSKEPWEVLISEIQNDAINGKLDELQKENDCLRAIGRVSNEQRNTIST